MEPKYVEVAKEMLQSRGHQVILIEYDCGNVDFISAKTIKNENVLVKFIPFKFSISILTELLKKYDIKSFAEFIVVCKHVMLSNLKKAENIVPNLEIFTESELSINIMKHFLQPKMEKIPNSFHFQRNNWPRMLETDPVAKFMRYRHGDVIQVHLKSGHISYRIVVKIKTI